MTHTLLHPEDKLPLTCSRTGTCCFGKQVLLNPWELATMAQTKGISVKEFSNCYCEFGGTRLLFNGSQSASGQKACSQYVDHFGCSLHTGRPLVCRLYPIGRRRQHDTIEYVYEGDEFPCMNGCPEVTTLPYMTTAEYLLGQQTEKFENAQNLYLELMQSIADIAFTLLLETGLADSGDKTTLQAWRKMSNSGPEVLAAQLSAEWAELLMQPNLTYTDNETDFVEQHAGLLQTIVQEKFDALQSLQDYHRMSVDAMGTALLLAFSLGTDISALGTHWIETAKANGAKE